MCFLWPLLFIPFAGCCGNRSRRGCPDRDCGRCRRGREDSDAESFPPMNVHRGFDPHECRPKPHDC